MNKGLLTFSLKDDEAQKQKKTTTVDVVSPDVAKKAQDDRDYLLRKAVSEVSSVASQLPAPFNLPFKAMNSYIDATGGVHKIVEEPGLIFERKPFYGIDTEEHTFKSGLSKTQELGISMAFTARDMAQFTVEAVPRALTHTLNMFSEFLTGGRADPLKLPFDARRIGFEKEFAESTGRRQWDYLQELNRVRPPATLAGAAMNVGQSIFAVVIPDILDVVVAGQQLRSISLKILQYTKYDPVMERSLSVLGISEEELGKMNVQSFQERALNSLRSANNPLEQAEVIKSGNYVFEKVTGMTEIRPIPGGIVFKESELGAIKQLNSFWQKAQDIARDLVLPIEQAGMGLKTQAITSAKYLEAPELVKMYSSVGIPNPEEVSNLIKSISSLSKKGVTPEMIAKQLEVAQPLVDAVVSGVIAEGVTKIPNEVLISMTSKLSKLDSLSPVTGALSDQAPSIRATAPLGDSMTTLDKTMGGKPTDEITVYSNTPEKDIVAGDYVTTNKQLAVDYKGGGKLTEKIVKKGDILDDITNPLGEEYIYRPNAFKEISTPSVSGKEVPVSVSITPEKFVKEATVKEAAPIKSVIMGKTPAEPITTSEVKVLKDRLQNISRGADIGAKATSEGIQKTQKELHNIINESGLSSEYKAELISDIRALAVGADPVATFQKNLPKTLNKIDNLIARQIKAAERTASKKLRELVSASRRATVATRGDV